MILKNIDIKRNYRQIKQQCIKRLTTALILITISNPGLADLSLSNFPSETVSFIKKNIRFYVNLSGGYSRLQYASSNTGQAGLLRLGLGTYWQLNDKFRLGSELGFQTGSQMLLRAESSAILGPNVLPITLYYIPPVDILLTIKWNAYSYFFAQAKGGFVHPNIVISGSDTKTSYKWLPDAQAGIGINLSPRSNVSVNYQRFFGKNPIITDLNSQGTSYLKNVPSLQAILLTAEISI